MIAIKRIVRLTAVALLLAAQAPAEAQTPQDKGLAIAREADRRYFGFGSIRVRLTMILRNKQGQISERELRVRTLEVEGEGTRSLCIFDSPADVKGTILLTHTHQTSEDNQWLFLPALKRVKRIAGRNRSGSFVGSEFSYEDIATQTLEKYAYQWLREESCNDLECYVVERRPVDIRNSGYTRQIVWIDKENYRTQKVDYYDRKDSLLKTLHFKDYRKYVDEFWRPTEMTMVNHQTGKSSQLIWSDWVFGTDDNENDFRSHNLPRIR